jgi:hypothetical protein
VAKAYSFRPAAKSRSSPRFPGSGARLILNEYSQCLEISVEALKVDMKGMLVSGDVLESILPIPARHAADIDAIHCPDG